MKVDSENLQGLYQYTKCLHSLFGREVKPVVCLHSVEEGDRFITEVRKYFTMDAYLFEANGVTYFETVFYGITIQWPAQ